MVETSVVSGNPILDRYLGRTPLMVLVYGVAGSGKTSLLLHIASNICSRVKCLFINTEGSLYYERVARSIDRFRNVFFIDFYDFGSFEEFVLYKYYYLDIPVVFIDSINALYREIAYMENSIERFGLVLGLLRYKALSMNGYVFSSAQVRAGFEEDEEEAVASGMSILDYWYDVIIRLGFSDSGRFAEVVKPLNETGRVFFGITDSGVEWINEPLD